MNMLPLNTSIKFFKYKLLGKSNTLPISISNCCLNPASNINIKGTIVIKSHAIANIAIIVLVDIFFYREILLHNNHSSFLFNALIVINDIIVIIINIPEAIAEPYPIL